MEKKPSSSPPLESDGNSHEIAIIQVRWGCLAGPIMQMIMCLAIGKDVFLYAVMFEYVVLSSSCCLPTLLLCPFAWLECQVFVQRLQFESWL